MRQIYNAVSYEIFEMRRIMRLIALDSVTRIDDFAVTVRRIKQHQKEGQGRVACSLCGSRVRLQRSSKI